MPEREQCFACFGHGVRCWTCGLVEAECDCSIEEANLGICDECDGEGDRV